MACPVDLIFGGASIGSNAWINAPSQLDGPLTIFGGAPHDHKVLDTAYVYSPDAPTTSESIIGEWGAGTKGWIIDTKADYTVAKAHSAKELRRSLISSLERLKVDKVRVFYLHHQEHETPLLETLQAIDGLYREGKFERFGVSNFTAEEVQTLIDLAEEHGYVKVSVYQGQYNALMRRVETDLLPTLRKNNISFFAYSPTAGGMFQEKYLAQNPSQSSQIQGLNEGRFAGEGRVARAYRNFYFKPAYFSTLRTFHEKLSTFYNENSIVDKASGTELAFRWLLHHSQLKKEYGDAVIVGTGCMRHVEEALLWSVKGTIEEEEVKGLVEGVWEGVKEVAPEYFN